MEESIALSREIGGLSGLAITLNNVAEVRFDLGDTAERRVLIQNRWPRSKRTGRKANRHIPWSGWRRAGGYR